MIYKKLLRLGAAYNEQVKTSEIVQVAVEGVDQLETYFGAYLPQFLYCKKKHGGKNGLYPECEELDAYARQQSDKCPFMETKTFCSNCRVHCYKPQMREKIREVMRFSGPRMVFVHPVTAIRHVVETKKEKKDWSINS